jgi:competence protein ComEC
MACLLRRDRKRDSRYAVVPHHGGDTNAEGFLSATTPEVAVISAGEDNPFGHPHPDVLADLVGVDVRRTDVAGDVVVPLHGGP